MRDAGTSEVGAPLSMSWVVLLLPLGRELRPEFEMDERQHVREKSAAEVCQHPLPSELLSSSQALLEANQREVHFGVKWIASDVLAKTTVSEGDQHSLFCYPHSTEQRLLLSPLMHHLAAGVWRPKGQGTFAASPGRDVMSASKKKKHEKEHTFNFAGNTSTKIVVCFLLNFLTSTLVAHSPPPALETLKFGVALRHRRRKAGEAPIRAR
jgi:hypothetical protein